MAERESHNHRPADAAKHLANGANGANGEQVHPKGAHSGLNEDIMDVVDINTIIKNSSSIINSKDSETSEVISELKKLGELADKKAVLELDKFLEGQEKNYEGRRTSAIPHALIALGKTEDKSMSTRIIRWMHDKHPDVRAAVADAVSYLRDTECSKAVADMLKDHDDKVRLAAVRSLATIGDVNAILPVCALAADSSSDVRSESAKSVVAIMKRDLRDDTSSDRQHKILAVARTVRDSFAKLGKSEKISLVRDSFDSCINDITTLLLSHEVKNAKNAVEAAQREMEKLIAENQQARQNLDKADKNIGDMAEENHDLRNEIKKLKKQLEESLLGNGELMNKLINTKTKVENAEKLIAEADALKQEVESLREQLSSEEGRRKSFGGTEKELQKQILTYKREVEEAGKRDDLYKKQIDDLQSTLRATVNKAGEEMKRELEEVENIKKEKQDIEAQIADLKKDAEEKTGKVKDAEDKTKQLETLESKLKESDEKIKILEDRVKTKENSGSIDNIMNTLNNIESKQKLPEKKKLAYKIVVGFLATAVLVETGLLVSTVISKNQNAKMAKISDTRVETANTKAQTAVRKLSRTETAYKEISDMDFVIGKFFTDPEAIISLHYKSRNKAEARQILDECRDKYWEMSDSIKEIGPEKACEEMRKYYSLVDMVGSGKLKDAKEKYKEVFGKEFKLLVF
jgi:hypothetical protein